MIHRAQHGALRRGVETYLDGEADPAWAGLISRHLTECWVCNEDAEWVSLIKTALGRLGGRQPSDLAVVRLARYAATLSERC